MCLQLSGTVDTVDTRDAAVITPHSFSEWGFEVLK